MKMFTINRLITTSLLPYMIYNIASKYIYGSRKKVRMEKGSNEPKYMFIRFFFEIKKPKYFNFNGIGLNETKIMLRLFFLRLD